MVMIATAAWIVAVAAVGDDAAVAKGKRSAAGEGASEAAAADSEDSALTNTALQSFLYGYPLVLMDTTRRSMTTVGKPGPRGAPMNQFFMMKELPEPSERWVVRPNRDTLYASAWLDLAEQPVVLHVPQIRDRFYLLQMLDAWTNVFAAPGTRTLRGAARDFAVVGPNWRGQLPAGVERINAPTNLVWIIARTEVKGDADLARAREVELQYTLQPLAARVRGEPPTKNELVSTVATDDRPPQVVARMDGVTFFRRLAELMRQNPPAAHDRVALDQLERLGVEPGHPFGPSPELARAIANVPARALAALEERRPAPGPDGWDPVPKNLGNYGTDYETRALVALVGLGANLPADALYPLARVDAKQRALSGDHRYVVHFAPGRTPPAAAFWSLTLYDDDGYLVPNDAQRYALRNRDPLIANPDGSLDLYISRDAPEPKLRANWLPAPKGTFNVLLRMYLPKAAALDGIWTPPPLERMNERSAAER